MPSAAANRSILVEVERHERHDVLPVVADHDGLADVELGLQEVLDVLRSDVLASGGLDEILLAIRDAKEAVGVDLADVAGMKPAFANPTTRRSPPAAR